MSETGTVGRHAVAYRTEIGRSHRVNQDSGGAWHWLRPSGTPVSLLIVADGVSAGRQSEEASKLAAAELHRRVSAAVLDEALDLNAVVAEMRDAALDANHEISRRPHASPASADATTLVAAICIGDQGGGVWVGDSRVYRVTATEIESLTSDHSWAEGAVREGFMSAAQAASDPRAHMITRWLGPPDQNDPGIEIFSFKVRQGDTILCCSDGLYGYFSPPAFDLAGIAEIVNQHRGALDDTADRLVDTALERGGHDDITVALLQAGA